MTSSATRPRYRVGLAPPSARGFGDTAPALFLLLHCHTRAPPGIGQVTSHPPEWVMHHLRAGQDIFREEILSCGEQEGVAQSSNLWGSLKAPDKKKAPGTIAEHTGCIRTMHGWSHTCCVAFDFRRSKCAPPSQRSVAVSHGAFFYLEPSFRTPLPAASWHALISLDRCTQASCWSQSPRSLSSRKTT